MIDSDPIARLARAAKLSVDLEVELASKTPSWLREIYRRFHDRAAEALVALSFADPEDSKTIRTLQNEVKRYDEFVADLRAIIQEGIAADHEMRDIDQEELLDVLTMTPDGQQQAAALGLVDLDTRE